MTEKSTMVVAVIGNRNSADSRAVTNALKQAHDKRPICCMIAVNDHGDGVNAFRWVVEHGIDAVMLADESSVLETLEAMQVLHNACTMSVIAFRPDEAGRRIIEQCRAAGAVIWIPAP